ncbi:MAG TPA: Ig-like domain-containing protein [Chryseolinea sp.]|nr:Ig-like domain-containing protein [Chryseolinea sp.]
MTRSILLAVVLSCPVFLAAGQPSPRLNVVDGVVYVAGLGDLSGASKPPEEHWREMFSVYTDEAFGRGLNQPIAGKYLSSTDGFSFEPMYPFSSGATYHAVFSPSALSNFINERTEHSAEGKVDFTFQIPSEDVSSTSIEAVYPASAILPENLLRMYICFSGPMMPGEAYKHIMVVNGKGERVERSFLIVDQELWDASRTRFTVLFDPGRIKRGLKSNLELGPPLKDGGQYSLVIDSAWRDVNGNNLQGGLVKSFRVNAPERTRLSVESLRVIAPPADTRGPLVVRFDRPMDRALVFKYVTVQDTSANVIRGQLELDNDDILKFTPDIPWPAGNYNVVLSPLLEDVAGNNFRNSFDVDLAQESRRSYDDALTLQFSIIPSAR